MPTYEFRNKETGEVIEKFCSIAERDRIISEGVWEMYHAAPTTIVSGVDGKKPDGAFRDLLKDMKKRHSQGFTKATINDW